MTANEDDEAVGFSDFVLSIATNAMAHLDGLQAEEEVPSRARLAEAAQHIDILAMLQAKTKGNLSEREQTLLDSLVYDLRMRFVALRGGD